MELREAWLEPVFRGEQAFLSGEPAAASQLEAATGEVRSFRLQERGWAPVRTLPSASWVTLVISYLTVSASCLIRK